jgi:hypothetical protein
MFLQKCFLLCLLAVCVRAANVVLNGSCYLRGSQATYTSLTLGANDTVTSITVSAPCNASTLRSVLVYSSSFYYIPPTFFTAFPVLQFLSLVTSNVREIRPNTFQNAKSLSIVDLTNNGIKNFYPYVFNGSDLLYRLYIVEPNSTVDVNAFRGPKNLGYLEVRQANFSIIGNTSFIDSLNLLSILLDLGSYSVKSLDRSAFSRLWNLQTLTLWNTKLTVIDKGLIQNNTNLLTADFRYCKVYPAFIQIRS